jgi:hypothetical protein
MAQVACKVCRYSSLRGLAAAYLRPRERGATRLVKPGALTPLRWIKAIAAGSLLIAKVKVTRQVDSMLKSNKTQSSSDDRASLLTISPEKVFFVIVKAREFDAKDVVTDPSPGSNPSRR